MYTYIYVCVNTLYTGARRVGWKRSSNLTTMILRVEILHSQ